MSSKIVVVTGSTSGSGYYCAQSLVNSDAVTSVVMACRNTASAKKAADSILYASTKKFKRGDEVIVLPEPCDLNDLVSVRVFAAALIKWLDGRKIHSLVNNAGVGASVVHSKNSVGHELMLATNHLGHFLLTVLLLPYITDRVVNVSSGAHDPAIKAGMPDPEIGYPSNEAEYNSRMLAGEPLEGHDAETSGRLRYARSKLLNVLFTNELAFRLSGDLPLNNEVQALEESVIAAANSLPTKACCSLPGAKKIRTAGFNPGLMLDSNFIGTSMGPLTGWFAYFMIPVARYMIGNSVKSSAGSGDRLAKLALGELGAERTEVYYNADTERPTSTFAKSLLTVTKYQGELWDYSVVWAGVTKEELRSAGF